MVGSRPGSVVASAEVLDGVLVAGTGLITAIPLVLFASAARSIPFTLLGPLNLIVPVVNFGLGWLVYGEAMPPERAVGFAFVWVALAVVMWDRVRAAPRRTGRLAVSTSRGRARPRRAR